MNQEYNTHIIGIGARIELYDIIFGIVVTIYVNINDLYNRCTEID
jgi:hypothetical protein